jgi:protocatechuate 3,4-dioxygenase beta subunit
MLRNWLSLLSAEQDKLKKEIKFMKSNSERRNFLKFGAGAAGILAAASPIGQSLAATCGLTPPQNEGPFYPGQEQFHPDNDITQIPGRAARALGQIIYVRGKVVDQKCLPVRGANVEIWQACSSGRYNNVKDPNPAPLDPGFKYWGEAFTDDQGEYVFKTIMPGSYPADTDWTRPPHIHFKIACLGYEELTTQLYFKGNVLNKDDLILRRIPAAERDRVVVDFQPAPAGFEAGSWVGSFDITLRSIRD